MIKKLNQAGDTIIEVLLAIVISSFVLTAAVVSTDSNLNVERQAQNRSIAVQIVQSQIEELDAYYSSNLQTFPAGYINSSFCMDPATAAPTPAASATTCYFSESDVYYPTLASALAASGNPVYSVKITFNAADLTLIPADPIYQANVTATWEQTGLGHTDNVTADYRLN